MKTKRIIEVSSLQNIEMKDVIGGANDICTFNCAHPCGKFKTLFCRYHAVHQVEKE